MVYNQPLNSENSPNFFRKRLLREMPISILVSIPVQLNVYLTDTDYFFATFSSIPQETILPKNSARNAFADFLKKHEVPDFFLGKKKSYLRGLC